MSTTAPYIAAGILLGLLQIAFGIAIGLWIRRAGRAAGDPCQLDEARARKFVAQLEMLASSLNQDVQGHCAHLSQINRRLVASRNLQTKSSGSRQAASLTDLVVGVVGEVLRANGRLQERLTSAEAQLQRQAAEIASHLSRSLTDDLTGLPNRRAFDEQLRQRLEAYARYRVPFSLMLIDIDFFKKVNDKHGHVAGDRVLSTIAGILRGAMRRPDFVARYGGEEFAAILPYTSLADAVHAARHARLAVEAQATLFDGVAIRVTASIGLTEVQEADDHTTMIKRADDALYASKNGGRNCGHMHDGVRCVRIVCDSAFGGSETGELSEMAEDPLAPELEAACAELRDFAAERL